ncbi:MAG TPA: alpha-galactosidase [Polyangium sp.]|nr:alpha-galactosidase [Polyangium sp.]
MKLECARGEIRYHCQHRAYSLLVDLAQGAVFDDGRIRISARHENNRSIVRVYAYADVEIDAFALYVERSFAANARFFLNGYQSWTDSREFSPWERIHPFPTLVRPLLERLFRTNHYGDYDIVPVHDRHLHGFTYFYMRQAPGGAIDFCGSLSEAEGFTIFRVLPEDRRVIIQKDCEGLHISAGKEWRAFDLHQELGDEGEVFANYLRIYQQLSNLEPRTMPTWTGWTSWYYHYTNISEPIIQKNLDAFAQKSIPIDVFQIDDGWQGAVGDWLDVNEKFPNGLRPIVERIHQAGYKAGLWLAPLVAERKSRIMTQHPEWLLRDREGNPIPAGNSNLWSGDFYGLDIDHEGLRSYLTQVFDTILNEWGFDLVKLDFLYGACLAAGSGKTRGAKMVATMDFLRMLVGNKFILGCGVPIGPAMGRVDVCRIGPDVGHEWTNTLTRGLGMRETISTVTALENAIGRHHLSGKAFSNDPDVFFLRQLSFAGQKFDPFVALQEIRWGKRVPLDEHEKYTLFLLNNIFGRLVFTSDDIDEYPDDLLALYLSSFPLREKLDVRVELQGPAPAFGEIGGCYQIQFRIGALHYWTYANLANETVAIGLAAGGFSRNERGQGRFVERGQSMTLAPHTSLCVLEEPLGDNAFLGSESHLFPGSDLAEWSWDGPDGVVFVRDSRARGKGNVLFRAPLGKTGLRVNGRFIAASKYLGREQVVVVPAEQG